MQIQSTLLVISATRVPRKARTLHTAVVTSATRSPITPLCSWVSCVDFHRLR